MKHYAVYYLIDPETQEKRYVGISNDPYRRFHAHLDATAHPRRHSACWIRGLQTRGLRPILRVAALVQSQEEAKRVEIALIAQLPGLTNISEGGEGGSGVRWSEERKAAQAARMRERYRDPRARAKLGEATKRGWDNPESRARASKASAGRRMSEEAKTRIATTLTGHAVSTETREKLRRAISGKKHTEETRLKMSQSHRGHLTSEEARLKISIANLEHCISQWQSHGGSSNE